MTFKRKLSSIEVNSPLIMAILNVTPDSFSDGGDYVAQDAIKRQLESMAKEQVDIVDVGGESTRPYALPVSLDEELNRVMPVIELAKKDYGLSVSVDTYKVEVMAESIKLGVDLINDVNALQARGAKELISQSDVCACLMHKQGSPEDMQKEPSYDNVVQEVKNFLIPQINECVALGISHERLLIDPGFGFGKTLEHNVALFKSINEFVELGVPVLVGVSRKKMIGDLLNNLPVDERMIGSVSAALLAVIKGAKVLRVHDFKETIQVTKVLKELM
jgi:dihydropteroate synthase